MSVRIWRRRDRTQEIGPTTKWVGPTSSIGLTDSPPAEARLCRPVLILAAPDRALIEEYSPRRQSQFIVAKLFDDKSKRKRLFIPAN
jgi:hypothetical protein